MEEAADGRIIETNEHPLTEIEQLKQFSIEEKQLFHLPSPHMTLDHMLVLTQYIEKQMATAKYNGIVITHGTDTLEETAFFVDLTVNASIPIIFTGAMRPSNKIGSDALYNLFCALRVASDPKSAYRGVLVVMNDEIHTAQHVTKTSTSNVATFQSPVFGPVGFVTKLAIHFHQKMDQTTHYPVTTWTKNVVLLKTYAGMSDELLQTISSQHVHGIIVEALGQGNVPPAIVPALQRFISEGITVVIVSRCFKGVVQPVYDYAGGGRALVKDGVIFANYLNGPKARLKLLLLLENNYDHEAIVEAFHD